VVIKSKLLRRQNKSIDSVATFIRRLAIRILLATEEHHNMMMMKQPSDRYQYVLEKKPELIQKVSLTHLSSYLGMSRETLSRIRSNKY
jgi:CRP-like cAMP-binding protein